MGFNDIGGDGELSEEVLKDNADYGQLMVLIGEGNSLEGIYRGAVDCPGYNGKGKQKSHSLEQKDGSIVKVRGFGLMDHILAKDVENGETIRVTYTGKQGDFHKCKVAKDDGIEAPEASGGESL